MVSAGVSLPEAPCGHHRVAAQPRLRQATRRGERRRCSRARASPAAGAHRPLPGDRYADAAGRRGHRHLDTQLEVTAEYYETELDYKIKKLTALFEPMVIIVMGLMVGFVAVALVSAMYGVFNQVKV